MSSPIGLSTYRWNNNLKSGLLLAAFPFLLLLLLAAIFYLWGWCSLDPATGTVNPAVFHTFHLPTLLGTGRPEDLALGAVYTWWPAVLGVAALWVLIGYLFNDSIIHMATGAEAVDRLTAPRLYNILENLCISRGMKMPMLYVIDVEEMNAYASGINDSSYAVTVTQGLLDNLNDAELEAVLAHELTHILNRDCRLLIVTIVFTGMISFVAQMLWRSLNYAQFSRSDYVGDSGGSNGEKRGGGNMLLMIIAAVVMAVGYGFALILRFALSRRREYLADAGSVELTKNPQALIDALRKISQNPDLPQVPSEVRQMFIENPPSAFDMGGLFATHPPIDERIHVLQQLGNLPVSGKSVIPNS